MPDIPAAFCRTMQELHGPNGQAWLVRLPDLIAECEQRWLLRVLPPFELTYNYVAPAIRADGMPVVLKLGVPHRELFSEIAALRLYDGRGAVRLLDADIEKGILLLERLQPGKPLAHLGDDERTTEIIAQTMRQLWRPVPATHIFPSIADWAGGLKRLRARYAGGTGPLDTKLVDQAERLFDELLASQSEVMVLHGDLHHWNVLSAERQDWLAIDPKGVVGEPTCDVGQMLLNALPDGSTAADIERIQRRRIDQFTEILGFDRQRLVSWCMAWAVLSAWWNVEDLGYGWEGAMACAGILARLL